MKNQLMPLLAAFALLTGFRADRTLAPGTPAADTRCYEMRVYYTNPGKFPDILARFRNHTTKLFTKHGMTNLGYFVPERKPDSCLIYFLSYPSREAREASWKAFQADPEWIKVRDASELNGKIVSKVESSFLTATDFSPVLNVEQKGGRVFELRTYKPTPDHLPNLLARFRDHTVTLFEKHGMTNLIYWVQNGGSPNGSSEGGTDALLVYLLAHPSKEAGLQSFKSFGQDPAWQAARKASEEKAGGSLTTYVRSEYLLPTDFSPLK